MEIVVEVEEKKDFWKSEKQKSVRKELIDAIEFGDQLISDDDYEVEFNWLNAEDISMLSDSDDNEL